MKSLGSPALLTSGALCLTFFLLLGTTFLNMSAPSQWMTWEDGDVTPSLTVSGLGQVAISKKADWQAIEQPLFDPARRQQAASDMPEAPAGQAPVETFRLIGSLASADARKVAIAPGDDQDIVWLSPGEMIAGWRILEASDNQVTLERSGTRQTLSMYTPIDQ
jgi:hypothetical protein